MKKERLYSPKKQFVLLGTLFIFPFATNAQFSDDIQSEKPNILWITIEDTSPQFIGVYGNDEVKTPVMDNFAKRGVRLTNAYATATVCAPSRSTIITGCSTEVVGTGNHRSKYPIPPFIKGFPYYLKQLGYYTSNNVKTDYNIADEKDFVNIAWDESSNSAGWWNRKNDQPFFSVFNLMDSHQSRTMTNSYSWYVENILDKLDKEDRTSPNDISIPPFYRDTPEMRKYFSRVHNSIKRTDIEIGEILERLRQEGLAENTIVFIFADHGEGIPKGKTVANGLGYHVPFFVYFPEKYKNLSPWPIGGVTPELISFEDLAPTMLSLAGANIPEYMKGRPFLGNSRKNPQKYVYASRNRIDDGPDLCRSVMDGKYVYTRVFFPQLPMVKFQKYADVADISIAIRRDHAAGLLNSVQAELINPVRPVEYLFDIENDPWEINNLASDKRHRRKLLELRKAMEKRVVDIRDVLFMPEGEMVRQMEAMTPWEMRMDKKNYDLVKILKVAELVGEGTSVLDTQFRYLRDNDVIVRYWAGVGLDAQGDNVIGKKDEILAAMRDDSSPSIRIIMAGIAWKLFGLQEAKAVLEENALGADPYLAFQSLSTIQYMYEKGKPFIPVLTEVIAKYKNAKDEMPYVVVKTAEVILHFIDGRELSY